MALKQFKDYASTQGYSDFEMLPRGGYVVEIKKATAKDGSFGQYVELMCDIVEGPYKDYYTNDYKRQTGEDKKWHCTSFLNVPNDDGTEQDGWTKRRFKTFTEALEESNPGYHFDWDESKFKGLKVGAVFNYRQYRKSNGEVGEGPNLANWTTVQAIHDDKYRIPEDRPIKGESKLLPVGQQKVAEETTPDGFISIPEGENTELPF